MKIRGQDFAELLDMVRESPVYDQQDQYRAAGMSDKRHRWDCLWSVPVQVRQPWFDRVYKFANDDHIDTALRKIQSNSAEYLASREA